MSAVYWKIYKYFWAKDYPLRFLTKIMDVLSNPIWFFKFTFYLNPRFKRYLSWSKADQQYLKDNDSEIYDLKQRKKESYIQQYFRQLEVTLNDDLVFDLSFEMEREAMCFCYEGTTQDEYEDELYHSIRNNKDYTDPREIYGESIFDALEVWFETESRNWNWAGIHRKEIAKQRKVKAWKQEVVYGY